MREPRNLPISSALREIEFAKHNRRVPRSRSPEIASKVKRSGRVLNVVLTTTGM